ncbi:helix-turn-helix domain-containing protein [Natronosalvus halobius]|uniref:helix-turn-helix domain-containing protein n=1 Tax=Natronosalvus halobius TaxID=2953746 RepID=UPI00209F364B|nr:helix-turn-helix domain-containing protein [Natronosalvus halobius]USZ70427.1 helix-turn-helix domain-containing protein [Natronosalvus halobius]
MIIVEFRLDHPILKKALNQVPEMEITWERSDAVDDSQVRTLVWAEGGDFKTFEDALDDDPTVAPPSRVIEVGDRRLYQIDLVGEGLRTSIYPLVVEEGGVIQNLTASHDGWEFRASFPDRTSFVRFHDFCREHEIGFDFTRMYDEHETGDGAGYGLTERQRETLVGAVDCGYFEIPRECSLAELGEHLGISETATSERVRRAVNMLIVQTVHSGTSEP